MPPLRAPIGRCFAIEPTSLYFRTTSLALLVLWAIYKQATPALLILGALAGAMQLLDAGIGLFEHDLGKCAGPLFIAILQFFVVYLLHRSVRITPQTKRG